MIKDIHNIILFCCFLLIISCKGKSSDPVPSESGNRLPVLYAKGFTITDHGNYFKVVVRDPIDTNRVFQNYYLYKDKVVNFNEGVNIKIPVNDIACLSTTHIGMIEKLDLQDKLIAFSGTEYIYSQKIQEMVSQNKIAEVGNEGALNNELLVSLHPDIIMGYDIGNPDYDHFQKLADLGLVAVLNNEYLELTPLGQAEWIKFMAVFFDKSDEANKIFDSIEKEYNAVRSVSATVKDKPTVFTGLAFKGEWTIPGGKSFAANYLNDAGADYLWSDDTKTGNFPVSIEEVLSRATNADFWLHAGAVNTLTEINAADERYTYFSARNSGNVFNNNNRVNENGGNDYWESGIINPQNVLKDLVKIFHPELMVDHPFIYYKKVE